MENLTPPANGKTAPPQPCRISSSPAPTTQAQSDTRTTCAAALGFFFSPWTRSTRAACQMMPRRLRTLHHLRRPDDDHDGQQQTSTTRRPDDAAPPAHPAPDHHASRPHHLRPICPAAYSSRPRRLLPTPCTACAAPMMTTTASRSARRGLAMARRRRGQILHLTGYSFASRGKAKRLYTALSIPQPPFFPGLALGCPPRRRRAAPAPPTVGGLPDEADGPPRPPLGTAGGVFRRCGSESAKFF